MRRTAALSFGILSALAACKDDGKTAFLSLPDSEGAKSMLLAIPKGGAIEVEAIRIVEGVEPTFHSMIDAGEIDEVPIQALLYDSTLEELNLEEGEVPAAAPGEAGIELPGSDRILTAVIDSSRRGITWSPAEALVPEIAAFRMKKPASSPCVFFDAPETSFDIIDAITYAVAIDDSHALLGTAGFRTYVVSLDGATELPRGSTSFRSAWRASTSAPVWLGDPRGGVWTGTLSPTGFDNLELVRSVGRSIDGMDGGPSASSGDDLVLYTTTPHSIEHFDGAAWGTSTAVSAAVPPLAWAGPGVALLRSPNIGNVFYSADGTASEEEIAAGAEITGVGYAPSHGALTGTSEGRIYRRNNGAWTEIEDESFGWWTVAIKPYRTGFIALFASGAVVQYIPGYGYCEQQGILPVISGGDIVPLSDDRLLLIGLGPARDRVSGVLVSRIP